MLLFFACALLWGVDADLAHQAQRDLFAARYDRAAESYAKLIHEDPQWALGYDRLVRALLEAERSKEAQAIAQQASERVPETSEGQTALAEWPTAGETWLLPTNSIAER